MSIEVLQQFGVRKRYITTLKREGFTTVERLDEWLKERDYDHFYLILHFCFFEYLGRLQN